MTFFRNLSIICPRFRRKLMNPAQIRFVEETLRLTGQDLARSFGVAPVTVARWEDGRTAPVGLQAEVLQGLHSVALTIREQQDEQTSEFIRGLVLLGIGALIFYLLSQALKPA